MVEGKSVTYIHISRLCVLLFMRRGEGVRDADNTCNIYPSFYLVCSFRWGCSCIDKPEVIFRTYPRVLCKLPQERNELDPNLTDTISFLE